MFCTKSCLSANIYCRILLIAIEKKYCALYQFKTYLLLNVLSETRLIQIVIIRNYPNHSENESRITRDTSSRKKGNKLYTLYWHHILNAKRYCLYVKEPKTTIVCLKTTLSLPVKSIADYVNCQNVRVTRSTCVPKHSYVQKNLLRCRNRVHRKNNFEQSLQNILIDNFCIKCCWK